MCHEMRLLCWFGLWWNESSKSREKIYWKNGINPLEIPVVQEKPAAASKNTTVAAKNEY